MHADERGFTLLEVLVAFIIAGLALGVLAQGVSGGLLAARQALRYEEALSRAQSRLASIDALPALAAEDREGDDGGGFRWHLRVSPLLAAPPALRSAAASPAARGAAAPMLYAVSATVSWAMDGRARSVTLETRRLGLAPPPAP